MVRSKTTILLKRFYTDAGSYIFANVCRFIYHRSFINNLIIFFMYRHLGDYSITLGSNVLFAQVILIHVTFNGVVFSINQHLQILITFSKIWNLLIFQQTTFYDCYFLHFTQNPETISKLVSFLSVYFAFSRNITVYKYHLLKL